MRSIGDPLLRPAVWAVVASTVSIALLGASLALAPAEAPGYLELNLVLAWVPFALGYLLAWGARAGLPRIVLAAAAVVWLAFLPNAPYLLTDLVHAGTSNGGASSLDIAALAACAATGLLLFFAGVNAVAEAVRLEAGTGRARAVAPACAIVASIGMYLGRVLRWNSWDLMVRPLGRLEAVIPFLHSPAVLARAAAFVLVAALVLRGSIAVLERVFQRQRI
jgi:uncharacterized membrane protein